MWNPRRSPQALKLTGREVNLHKVREPLLQQTAHFFFFKLTIERIIDAMLFNTEQTSFKLSMIASIENEVICINLPSRKISREGYTFASIPPARDDKATVFLPSPPTKENKNSMKTVGSVCHCTLFVIFCQYQNRKLINQ